MALPVFGVNGLIIVFPMAGRSQRFRNAGYEQPKFMLPLQGATMFEHAVTSFKQYFDTATFLFVTRDQTHADFAADHARSLELNKR
jgi:CTP:molybdopterin cytidylyltransferase MocA